MKCPECNHQNPDDATICEKCYLNFSLVRTSKLAILSMILGLSSLFLFVITGLPAIVLGFISILKIRKSHGQLKGKGLARAGIITSLVLMIAFFLLWRIDAPPIPNDYTINDIKSASPEYNQSYETLHSIVDSNDNLPRGYTIGLSAEDVNNLEKINDIFSEYDLDEIPLKIMEQEDKIQILWDKAIKGRYLVKQLDSFPEIADISEPYYTDQLTNFKDFKYLTILYKVYICLQTCKGNYKDAINEFVIIDSVFKKISLNARTLISKLFCIACLAIDVRTANFMINNSETPNEILFALQDQVETFSDEHTSLKNTIIFEYLTYKKIMENLLKEPRVKYSVISPFKYNSALRLERNFLEKWLAIDENRERHETVKVWPNLYPNFPSFYKEKNKEYELTWYYRIYNPFSYAIFNVTRPNFDRLFEIKTRLEIDTDMLKIILNSRLGEDVDLKARAYGNDYIIDIENKKIFSPGPDGIKDTKDDITLPINPEVLHLSE